MVVCGMWSDVKNYEFILGCYIAMHNAQKNDYHNYSELIAIDNIIIHQNN